MFTRHVQHPGVADRDTQDRDTQDRDTALSTPASTSAPQPLPEELAGSPARFLNRENSWLDFNARVLALAEDGTAPLLERTKFLAICATNLDEFFMVRVAGLIRRMETGLGVRSADGLSTRRQLEMIRAKSRVFAQEHARVFLEQVQPALADSG